MGWKALMSAFGKEWVIGLQNSENRGLKRRWEQLFVKSAMTVMGKIVRLSRVHWQSLVQRVN